MARNCSISVGNGHCSRPTHTQPSRRPGGRCRLLPEATTLLAREQHTAHDTEVRRITGAKSFQPFFRPVKSGKQRPGCSATRFVIICNKARFTNNSEQSKSPGNMFSSATSTEGVPHTNTYSLSWTQSLAQTLTKQGAHATHLLCSCLRFGLPFLLAHPPRCLFLPPA